MDMLSNYIAERQVVAERVIMMSQIGRSIEEEHLSVNRMLFINCIKVVKICYFIK